LNCTSCNAEIPAAAKFCPDCGAKVTSSTQCANCGEQVKSSAKFCHGCGAPVSAEVKPRSVAAPAPVAVTVKSNRAIAIASFVAIPAFAILIIALLFWKNEDPGPLQASGGGSVAEESAPSMAAMQSVHDTLERLKKRLEDNPNDLVAMDSLASMYTIAGSHEKASQFYEQHLAIEPENTDVKMMLAHSYFQMQKIDDAMKIVQSVLKKEPANALALFNLGVIYSAQGKKEEATQHLQIIVDTYPGTEWAKRAEQLIHELTHEEGASSN
jgi:cytochrome c-type biogenesis protein CcmH/NrfG